MAIGSPDCPSHVPVNGSMYNKLEIRRVVPQYPKSTKEMEQKEEEERYYREAELIKQRKIAKRKIS